jgi:multicomponent Na+:H+ antiporter subunit A
MLAGLLLIFIAAAIAPWLTARRPAAAGWVLAAVPAGLFVWYSTRVAGVAAGEIPRESYAWVRALGADLSLRLDGLSLLFALLITGMGALVVLYSAAYLERHPQRGRFFSFLFLFTGAMLGLVLADNIIVLFVFWELTSFSSYLLIGFDHGRPAARERALQALLVTGGGGLALLAGLLLLGAVAGGAGDLSAIAGQADAVRRHSLYFPILLLVALGAFTKSAQVPFHFWLPNAMDAPTPVSAFLHSATMVKAGVYLLARLQPVLGGTAEWTMLLVPFGAVTAVVGAVMALRQVDLKLVLAYSTLAALGTLTMSLGAATPAATGAAVVFLAAHALYKGALFLSAGAVDHAAGTRDVTTLGGLRLAMPVTWVATLVAGLSMAGVPLLFGFVGKELLYKAQLGAGAPALLLGVAVGVGMLTVVAAGLVAWGPWAGGRRPLPQAPHEVPAAMLPGVVLPAAAGLAAGLAPAAVVGPVAGAATAAITGSADGLHLAPWYGFDLALALSAATLLGGVALYPTRNRIREALARADTVMERGPERVYEIALAALQWFAAWLTRTIQNGQLRFYIFTVLAVLLVLPGYTLWRSGVPIPLPTEGTWFYMYVLAGVIAAGAVGAAVVRSRVTALACVGVVGVGISVLFVLLGAPDLAMTQFLVDMLVVVVALLVMRLLPPLGVEERSRPLIRRRDAILSVGIGALVSLLLIAVVAIPLDRTIPDYYASTSVPGAYGRNIVNVILVDFRALDTLGEIIVLAVAAIGARALVRFRKMPPAWTPPPASLILRTTTRFLFTLLLLYSLYLLLRGHDAPGGGFIGGLTASGAFALYLLAYGAQGARAVLRVSPRGLLAVGLLLALLSGIVPLLMGAPFLAAQWTTLGAASATPLKLGTPLLFDLGVYLVVVGFVMTMALDLEEA